MACEKGTIVRIADEMAWAKVQRTGSCEGCSERGACGINGGVQNTEVEAINDAGAKVGDRVLIDVNSASVLKTAFLLYVFPILAMIVGAVIGNNAPPFFGLGASPLSAIFGFLFFGGAVLFAKNLGNRLATKKNYRLRVVKILGK